MYTIVVEDKKIILNLNENEIRNTEDLWTKRDPVHGVCYSLISVREGGNLTVNGNGKLLALKNDCYAFEVCGGGRLVIENGTFEGNVSVVYVEEGSLEVKGGFFKDIQDFDNSSHPDARYTLNCYDPNYKGKDLGDRKYTGSASIVITGGVFDSFNPQDCAAEGVHTNFVAAGYVAEKISENEYTVRSVEDGEVASINGKTYGSMDNALSSVGNGECIVLLSDIESLSVSNGKSFTLNLGGRTINNPSGNGITVSGKETELVINGQGSVLAAKRSAVQAIEDGDVVVNSGSYVGCFGIAAGSFNAETNEISNGYVTINGGTFESQEFTIPVWGSSTAVVNDGTFVARDNAVIGTNGNKAITDKGCVYEITINGGAFTGGIQSDGYIACGVYACNKGKVSLNGGTFNITDGVGVVARSGEVTVGENVEINLTSTEKLTGGKVGDSTIKIKANSQIVRDEKSDYPAGSPIIRNNSNYKIVDIDGNEIQN